MQKPEGPNTYDLKSGYSHLATNFEDPSDTLDGVSGTPHRQQQTLVRSDSPFSAMSSISLFIGLVSLFKVVVFSLGHSDQLSLIFPRSLSL